MLERLIVLKICLQMFEILRLRTHTYDAFRRHARTYLEPAIIHSWNKWQEEAFNHLIQNGEVILGGDMRADSPGLFGQSIICFAMMNYSFELPCENVSYFRTLSKIWQLYNDELEDQ